jgi:hypothetical protein
MDDKRPAGLTRQRPAPAANNPTVADGKAPAAVGLHYNVAGDGHATSPAS